MPTFNEYQNDSGYYIRAWTTNVGNINYKIRPEGNPVVEDYGLTHKDDISWETIKSLKLFGLIYTDKSGTIKDEDFNPDPDQIEETSLTNQEAKRLLKSIRANIELDHDRLKEICSMLDVQPPRPGTEKIEKDITKLVKRLFTNREIPIDHTLTQRNTDLFVEVHMSNKILTPDEAGVISIELHVENTGRTIQHNIHLNINEVESWSIFAESCSWEQRGEITVQKGILMPAIIRHLNRSGFDLTTPRGEIKSYFTTIHD